MNLKTGGHHALAEVVGDDRGQAIRLRMAIKEAQLRNEPVYACSECGVPVSLLMHPESGRFYFKHALEDGRCSAITRGELSRREIDARKYNLTKESARHIKMKELVARSLHADPRFSDIRIEGRWTGGLNGEWRRPDVQAIYDSRDGHGGIRIAFEIQLSPTYLDVLAERRLFYLKEGGLLFWIFARFSDTDRRLSQDDVFFNNNQNAFLVNEKTTAASIARKEFHLSCAWCEPESAISVSSLRRKTISFHDLVLHPERRRAYYFDFDAAWEAAQPKNLADPMLLREGFEAAWLAWMTDDGDLGKAWGDFYQRFRALVIPVPFYPQQLPKILLNALYSAKYGRVVGWRYRALVDVAHRIADEHKGYLRLFRHALRVYSRGEQILREDRSGKWAARAMRHKRAIRAGAPAYRPDETHYETLAFLFPELFAPPAQGWAEEHPEDEGIAAIRRELQTGLQSFSGCP